MISAYSLKMWVKWWTNNDTNMIEDEKKTLIDNIFIKYLQHWDWYVNSETKLCET